jgi:hypothetical protein
MLYKNLPKIKNIIYAICISIILSSLTTFFLKKYINVKHQVSIILKENYDFKSYLFLHYHPLIAENFKNVKLEYMIKLLRNEKNSVFIDDEHLSDFMNLKKECGNAYPTDFELIDSKTIIMRTLYVSKDLNTLNLCNNKILHLLNFTIKNEIIKKKKELKKLIDLNDKLVFMAFGQLDLVNILDNYFLTEPVILVKENNQIIIKLIKIEHYFIATFICFLIIILSIFERNKLLKLISK